MAENTSSMNPGPEKNILENIVTTDKKNEENVAISVDSYFKYFVCENCI